jgi:hypothetical protein
MNNYYTKDKKLSSNYLRMKMVKRKYSGSFVADKFQKYSTERRHF